MTRPALPYDYHAMQTVLNLKKYSESVIVYAVFVHLTNISFTNIKYFKYRLQSMYNHMVGRAALIVSPFYSILLGL